MYTILLNPNQMQHFGVNIQDDLTSDQTLSIIIEDDKFGIKLKMKDVIIYANTHTPTTLELEQLCHTVLSL